MITILTGDNSFEIDRAVRGIIHNFSGTPERFDANSLELSQLPDLLMGATLFTSDRLVIIKDLSTNKGLWENFADWLARISNDIQLVLIEPKLDRRTKTYKAIQKQSHIQDFKLLNERDIPKIERWVIEEASKLGIDLDSSSARTLITRVGIDQWRLYHSLEKLAVLDQVTISTINEFIDLDPIENIFNLFETALKGESKKVSDIVHTLLLREDPYRLFGLLSGQAFNLVLLVMGDMQDMEGMAKEFGVHPFALSKLSLHARRLGRERVGSIIRILAEADGDMKMSVGNPWLLIEHALIKISYIH